MFFLTSPRGWLESLMSIVMGDFFYIVNERENMRKVGSPRGWFRSSQGFSTGVYLAIRPDADFLTGTA